MVDSPSDAGREQVKIFPVGNKKMSQIQKQEHRNEQEQQPADTKVIDQ